MFREKDRILKEINADPENTFVVGHNQFSTWADHEYKKLLGFRNPNGPITDEDDENTVFLEEAFAADVDWRTKGVVNKVKD